VCIEEKTEDGSDRDWNWRYYRGLHLLTAHRGCGRGWTAPGEVGRAENDGVDGVGGGRRVDHVQSSLGLSLTKSWRRLQIYIPILSFGQGSLFLVNLKPFPHGQTCLGSQQNIRRRDNVQVSTPKLLDGRWLGAVVLLVGIPSNLNSFRAT
jgi:hypothetical protein